MNKLLKATLASLAVAAASSSPASAFSSFAIDANSVGFAGADVSVTEFLDFSGASFIQNTFTSANTFTFTDNGVFKVVGSDTFNVTSVFGGNEITAVLTGGAGTGTLSGGLNFTAGTISFYSDPLKDYGTAAGAAVSTFGANNGTLIGTFNLLSGTGTVDAAALPNGEIRLTLQATSLLANTWFDEFGNDLSFNPEVFNFVTSNATLVATANELVSSELVCELGGFNCPTGTPFNNAPFNFLVSNNGQDRMAVPEPGSLALMGAGLMALGSLRRRARKA